MKDIAKVGMEIYNKLINNGYNEIVQHIDYLESIGATGGEIVMDYAAYLVKLRTENPSAYKVIEVDLKMYLELCKSYGININNSPFF